MSLQFGKRGLWIRDMNYRKVKKKESYSPNRKTQWSLSILIICYLSFLTSGWWLPDGKRDEKQTPLYDTVTIEGHSYTITRWTYSRDESRMQVEIDIYNGSFDGINAYQYGCIASSGKRIGVEPVIETPTMLVLLLTDVPENFGAVSLRITPEGMGKDARVRLYTNKDAVEQVGQIQVFHSTKMYLRDRLIREIERLKEEKEVVAAQIGELTAKQEECKDLIEQMEAKLTELSVAEAETMKEKIAEATRQFDEYTAQLITLQEQIFDLEHEIGLDQEQLDEQDDEEGGQIP